MNARHALLGGILFSALCNLATADLTVSFDMDPGTEGLQSHRIVAVGEQFDVSVLLDLKGDTSLSSYAFSIRFLTDPLDVLDRTETPPPPLSELDDSNPIRDLAGSNDSQLGIGNYGELNRFDGITLSDGPTAPNTFQVATLSFRASALGPQAGPHLMMVAGLFESGFDGFYDNAGFELSDSLTFAGGSLTIVPEPSSWILVCAAVLIGCSLRVMRSRRR